jgi:hypothetical protein
VWAEAKKIFDDEAFQERKTEEGYKREERGGVQQHSVRMGLGEASEKETPRLIYNTNFK